MKNILVSHWLRGVGWLLSILALIYVGHQLLQAYGDVGAYFRDPVALLITTVVGVAYAATALLIALAWHILLRVDAQSAIPIGRSISIFGKTQFLKYLPSNVLHVVGRYALVRAERVPHATIAFSTVAELVLVTATAMIVATIFAKPLLLHFVDSERLLVYGGIAGAIGIASAFALWLHQSRLQAEHPDRLLLAMAAAVGLYAVFFLLNGILLSLLATQLSDRQLAFQPIMLGLVATAWTAGFLVPGAPAGIGVREAVLIAGMEIAQPGLAAVVVAISYRIATVLGDGMLAAGCAILDRRLSK